MIYARIRNGKVDEVGLPPATAVVDGRPMDLRGLELATLAAAGWHPLVEVARPADTVTELAVLSYEVINGNPTEVWSMRAWTPDETAPKAEGTNLAVAEREAIQAERPIGKITLKLYDEG